MDTICYCSVELAVVHMDHIHWGSFNAYSEIKINPNKFTKYIHHIHHIHILPESCCCQAAGPGWLVGTGSWHNQWQGHRHINFLVDVLYEHMVFIWSYIAFNFQTVSMVFPPIRYHPILTTEVEQGLELPWLILPDFVPPGFWLQVLLQPSSFKVLHQCQQRCLPQA